MNCKDIQELLPLYVGHDLPVKRASRIATHIQSCVDCASVEHEYRESRQLVQLFAPPAFSQGVYDGIRGRVLRQIEEESRVASLAQPFSGLLRPRLSWAIAAALVLGVLGFAIYFIANRPQERQLTNTNAPLNATPGKEQSGAGLDGSKLVATPPLPNHTPAPPNGRIIRNKGPHKANVTTHQPQQVRTAVASANRGNSVTVESPDAQVMTADAQGMTAEASANIQDLTTPESIPAVDSTSTEKTIRVEMQTKDRNIRIIWFSHPSTKQDFPNKSSEGI